MSRAGEGKNESSAGKRVIVAKGQQEGRRHSRAGQGGRGHDATGGGYWRVVIGQSL